LPHMVVPTTMGKKPPLKFVPLSKYMKELENPEPKKRTKDKTPEEIIEEVERTRAYNREKEERGD